MKKNLIWTFYLLFGAVFTFVTVNTVLRNEYFKPLWIAVVTVICLAALVLIYRIFEKYEKFLDRHYTKILAVFLAVMFVSELIFGIILRYDPMWDVGAVQKGAAEWARTGTFAEYYWYYSGFQNNLGSMAFLALFFKIALIFGITDFYAVGVFITCVMLCITMALSSLTCRELSSTRNAVFVLLIYAMSAQYWFMGGAVYTDAMSMLFPVLIFWLYLKSKDMQGRKKLLIYVCMGLAAAVGSLIKFTVIIMALAVVIAMCFREKPRETVSAAACMGLVLAIVTACFNAHIYSSHLDRETVRKEGRPYVHWIMMGLKGDGRYNPSDYEFTDSFSDPDKKRAEIRKEIGNRVKSLGVTGIFNLITKKSVLDFGDGTYGIDDFLQISPQNETKLHDWVLSDGKHYKTYGTYATGMHMVVMIFMLMSAWVMAFRKDSDKEKQFALYLAVFGVWLFLMMWETNRRYFSNFAPVIFIMAALGADNFMSVCAKVKNKFKTALKQD